MWLHLPGGKYESDQITKFFYPNHDANWSFQYPADHLFPIQGYLDEDSLKQAYSHDEEGQPCYVVAKDGQTTDLTFGRLSTYEAYVASELAGFSWELAIFNLNSENFSARGDSGSCIFNADGKMVGFLHSAGPKDDSVHITLATPAHFVIDQIRKRYPYADFDRHTFADVPDTSA
jgi:hypothetical protein